MVLGSDDFLYSNFMSRTRFIGSFELTQTADLGTLCIGSIVIHLRSLQKEEIGYKVKQYTRFLNLMINFQIHLK